jgi:large subunit ribosomal protein L1
VDVAVNLGVDPRKSDQVVRSATVLPHGTGKTVRVAVFAQGANADAARAAGADVVGFEDLAESVKAGNLDFDVVIAAPDAMRMVGQLGKILGPRGLMPNPKVGTVTPDVAGAIRNAKAGQVRYRTDKAGIIHCTIGKVDFAPDQLQENLQALLHDLQKIKPATSKGVYIRRVTVSTTMGPGLAVDQATLVILNSRCPGVDCQGNENFGPAGTSRPASKTAGALQLNPFPAKHRSSPRRR